MTRNYFDKELQELQLSILKMSSIVEESLNLAITALRNKDIDMAKKVIDSDDIVDNLEYEIEDKCYKLIALQQPIAKDLRVIGTALKIISDLERIADHAVDISKITLRLCNEKYIKQLIDIPRMGEIACKMVKDSIDAYVNQDIKKAKEISKCDDEVDALHSQIFRELLLIMMEEPKKINQATHFLFVSKYLERIADHVTNICERIIYSVTSEHLNLNQ